MSTAKQQQDEAKDQAEVEALFAQKIAEQKKVLKGLSKNQLVRIVVDMSIRAFYRQAEIDELKTQLGESNEESISDSVPSTES